MLLHLPVLDVHLLLISFESANLKAEFAQLFIKLGFFNFRVCAIDLRGQIFDLLFKPYDIGVDGTVRFDLTFGGAPLGGEIILLPAKHQRVRITA